METTESLKLIIALLNSGQLLKAVEDNAKYKDLQKHIYLHKQLKYYDNTASFHIRVVVMPKISLVRSE